MRRCVQDGTKVGIAAPLTSPVAQSSTRPYPGSSSVFPSYQNFLHLREAYEVRQFGAAAGYSGWMDRMRRGVENEVWGEGGKEGGERLE